MACCCTCIALLLLIGQIAAAPESELALRESRTATCQNQISLSNRLDTVEQRVEDTVKKLEGELAGLLDAIENPDLNFLPNSHTAGPSVDIFDETNPNTQS